jgi:hypothetical protein
MMQHSGRIILQFFLSVIFLSLAISITAQEMWGITTSNYAGSTGALLNPCAINTSKLYMDVNILTADIFFENNYGYIHRQDYSLFKFLSPNPSFPKYGPDELPFDHYTTKNPKFVYSSEIIIGPSAMISVGQHAFAIHTGARALTSAYNVPLEICNFGYYGLQYTPQHNINYMSSNVGSTALVMGEVGISYAYSFRKISMEDWTAGITIKRMFSIAGGYVRASDANYIVLNDTSINIKNLNAEVGFSIPLDYNSNAFPDSGPLIKGGGFGFDLGVTFQNKVLSYQKRKITKLCRQRYIDYIYKIGVSVLDIGYVNFKKNAELHSFTDVSKYWINFDTLNFYSMDTLMQTLSNVFYGDPNASYVDNKIKVYLPTALSIQADYKVYRHWYAGVVLIQPLQMGKAFIRRPAQIALIPRYESPQLEFSFPFSLYDYRYPRLGFSVRYHFLTIGTDEMLSLFGLTNFTGLDFYISFKINFSKGNCGRFKRNVPCENEEYGIRGR